MPQHPVLATIFFEIDGMTLSAVPLNFRVASPPHVNNFPCHAQDHVGFLWVVRPQVILANSKNAHPKMVGSQNNIGIVAFRCWRK